MAVKKKLATSKKEPVKKRAPSSARNGSKGKSSELSSLKPVREPFTRTVLMNHIAEQTGLTKKQVTSVFDQLKSIMEGHVKKGSAQVFTLPGLLKVKVIRKPATKARKGINPFTGEETVFKAKPARNVVKVQPLKGLKDMVVTA